MNKSNYFLLLIFSFFLFPFSFVSLRTVSASYVLPYPSLMPGNKLYRVSQLIDAVKKYWHWGNLASYRYELGQSDKALVEAKTLFEYRQYLLAVEALDRSNSALARVPGTLIKANQEGKNIEKFVREYRDAMDEHKRILTKIIQEVPEQFTWAPEKSASQSLSLHRALLEAKRIREESKIKLP